MEKSPQVLVVLGPEWWLRRRRDCGWGCGGGGGVW